MGVTYKQIAEIVGVSRGTVDRALHNRGRVDPKVAKRIKEVAKELGFEPSRVGRALAMSKKPIKIGVVAHLTETTFMQEVLSGIYQAQREIQGIGGELLIQKIPWADPQEQIRVIDQMMEEGIQGLAISPVEDEALRQRLKKVIESGLPVVTFNTDMVGIDRMCFVGLDNHRAGKTAAGLMNVLLGEQGGKILIIMGFMSNASQSQRVQGFVEEVALAAPNIEILGIQMSMDTEEKAQSITLQTIENYPDVKGVFMVSGGQEGVCRALKETGKNNVKLIVFDMLPETSEGLQEGVIDFIIDQNALAQGRRPPRILFDYLFDQVNPALEYQFTDIIIKTKYNI